MLGTNVALAAVLGTLMVLLGAGPVLMVQGATIVLASIMGV